MTGKKYLKILLIFCCILAFAYIVKLHLRTNPQYAILGMAEGVCKDTAILLKQYYAELSATEDMPHARDVVKFIVNQRSGRSVSFSSQAPVDPYKTPVDLGIYFLLPEKLESDSPTLIAYTTRIKRKWRKREQFFRIGLFLIGTDINVVTLPYHAMEKIIGKEKLEQAEPDLYYWPYRGRYLKESAQEERD